MTDEQIHELLTDLENRYAELMAADADPGELGRVWREIMYFRELEAVEA